VGLEFVQVAAAGGGQRDHVAAAVGRVGRPLGQAVPGQRRRRWCSRARKRLWEIDEADWQDAFVGLATAHLAVARATIPRLTAGGTYQVVVGDSATVPVPGSGLVSMEQSAVLMMRRVLAAEQDEKRIFALVLGPVRTRVTDGDPSWVTAGQIGQVAVAAAGAPGQEFHLDDRADADAVLDRLRR
jgi:3-oxoacyl-[acyl-carrier protein] reductase